MRRFVLASLLVSSAVAVAAPAAAQITTFTNRGAFAGAAAPLSTVDFESFATDTSFRTSPVDAGPFSVRVVGTTASNTSYNFVDVAPAASSESDVNGTNNLRVFTDATSSFFFQFDNPTTAFGADFRSFNDSSLRTLIFVDGMQITPPVSPMSGALTFFGFTSTSAFSTVEFRGVQNDVFGIDDVSFSRATAAVPEPATWAMMLFGFGGLGYSMRRRSSAGSRVRYA